MSVTRYCSQNSKKTLNKSKLSFFQKMNTLPVEICDVCAQKVSQATFFHFLPCTHTICHDCIDMFQVLSGRDYPYVWCMIDNKRPEHIGEYEIVRRSADGAERKYTLQFCRPDSIDEKSLKSKTQQRAQLSM